MVAAPIPIWVLQESQDWKIKYEGVVLDYETQKEAIAAAFGLACALSKEGQSSHVITGMLTSLYGPAGFIRTIPTRRRSTVKSREIGELDSLSVSIFPPPPLVPALTPSKSLRRTPASESNAPRSNDVRPKPVEERGRLLRIAAAFESALPDK